MVGAVLVKGLSGLCFDCFSCDLLKFLWLVCDWSALTPTNMQHLVSSVARYTLDTSTVLIKIMNDCNTRARQLNSGMNGIPSRKPPTSGIVRHDSHVREPGSDPAENRTRFALMGFSASVDDCPGSANCADFDKNRHVVRDGDLEQIRNVAHAPPPPQLIGIGTFRGFNSGQGCARLWKLALCLIGYCVQRKVPYWLDCKLASRLPRADWRTAFRRTACFFGRRKTVQCWSEVKRSEETWAALNIEDGGNEKSPRKPSDQRHRPILQHGEFLLRSGNITSGRQISFSACASLSTTYARSGETEDPRENPPTNGIVRARFPHAKIRKEGVEEVRTSSSSFVLSPELRAGRHLAELALPVVHAVGQVEVWNLDGQVALGLLQKYQHVLVREDPCPWLERERRNLESSEIFAHKCVILGCWSVEGGEIWVSLNVEVLRADEGDANEEIWAARNSEVLRADAGDRSEYGAGLKGRWETGGPRENPPTNAIVRHDSHMRKSGDPAGDWARFALVGGERANRSATVAAKKITLFQHF
ncbi:hypothetical protein PR048_024479 [Dryococelus australis]|uniref:Uncharacterized protein n=1 Tax=Dryococelus australis TaxID=614101 RepID=A0ABQ9GNR7_9NEOP|nr:hypothetical protein PR048_024479 [Dryococelus australis]